MTSKNKLYLINSEILIGVKGEIIQDNNGLVEVEEVTSGDQLKNYYKLRDFKPEQMGSFLTRFLSWYRKCKLYKLELPKALSPSDYGFTYEYYLLSKETFVKVFSEILGIKKVETWLKKQKKEQEKKTEQSNVTNGSVKSGTP